MGCWGVVFHFFLSLVFFFFFDRRLKEVLLSEVSPPIGAVTGTRDSIFFPFSPGAIIVSH